MIMVLALECNPQTPRCISFVIYSTWVLVAHFNKDRVYPLLYRSWSNRRYQARLYHVDFSSFSRVSSYRNRQIDVIYVLSPDVARNLTWSTLGVLSVCWMID